MKVNFGFPALMEKESPDYRKFWLWLCGCTTHLVMMVNRKGCSNSVVDQGRLRSEGNKSNRNPQWNEEVQACQKDRLLCGSFFGLQRRSWWLVTGNRTWFAPKSQITMWRFLYRWEDIGLNRTGYRVQRQIGKSIYWLVPSHYVSLFEMNQV